MCSERTHIIRLVQNPGAEGLGFKFVGGLEFGVGIFVCEVIPRSQAEKKGLKVYSKEGEIFIFLFVNEYLWVDLSLKSHWMQELTKEIILVDVMRIWL